MFAHLDLESRTFEVILLSERENCSSCVMYIRC